MKRREHPGDFGQQPEDRGKTRFSTEPRHRGAAPLAKARKENPKVTLKPGTKDEKILGPNSTKSNKPR